MRAPAAAALRSGGGSGSDAQPARQAAARARAATHTFFQRSAKFRIRTFAPAECPPSLSVLRIIAFRRVEQVAVRGMFVAIHGGWRGGTMRAQVRDKCKGF